MVRCNLLCLAVLAGVSLASADAFAAPDEVASMPTVDRVALRKELAAQRKLNLARLHRYRVKRIYPHNTYEAEKMLNVWTDAEGHLCAVATLMDKAGLHDLVASTAEDDNFVRVADVTSGPLLDWVLGSGFTQEEIVMIQQPNWEEEQRAERSARRAFKRAIKREDARLEKNYIAIERALKQRVIADAGLDLAVARLEKHPELVAALHASIKASPAPKTAKP